MNITRWWSATIIYTMFITFAAASNEVIQSECMDKDGVIERFKNKNCTWVGLKTERKEKKCRKKERVRIHCMKTCNNCPFPSPPKYFGFVPVKSSSTEWNDIDAFAEVEIDLKRLGSLSYSMEGKQQESNELEEINDYAINRNKNVKVVASRCKVYAGLLTEFPDMSDKLRDGFYESMMNIALAFNGTYVEKESFIEGVQMRGWPFKIDSNVEEFESYQGGKLMEAIALAAEQAALRGDIETAVSFALTVAGALYDGFLTKDLKRTKLGDDGSVVYVPDSAPEDRRERHRNVYKMFSGTPIFNCPGQPQAINHGLSAATAGIGLVRAFGAIGWLEGKSESRWKLTDSDGGKLMLKNYTDDLENFVSRSADVLRTKVCRIKKTGDSEKDNYAGPDGKEWYRWKYKKMSKISCPSYKNNKSNRPEDIAHARVEIMFATKARAVGNDYFKGNPNHFGIFEKDIHRFLMTVLNRFIIDPKGEVVNRFSCDIGSEIDPLSKACGSARAMPGRLKHVSQLLSIVNAARYYPEVRCDALSIVSAILPIFLEGHKDFHAQFGYKNSKKFLLEPLITKYYFYWYEAGIMNCQKE